MAINMNTNNTIIICKVNGETILNLNNNQNINNNCAEDNDKYCDNRNVDHFHQMVNSDHNEDIEIDDNSEEIKCLDIKNKEKLTEEKSFVNNIRIENMNNNKSINNLNINGKKRGKQKVYNIEEVTNGGIESVREYVLTTRKCGKVWHQCLWKACKYGSKWSGAMLNHCRKHLGIKPFMCNECGKLFTIACNLKNHLRIHHGIKGKIVANNSRRKSSKNSHHEEHDEEEKPLVHTFQQNSDAINGSNGFTSGNGLTSGSKFRIFKPRFINGCVGNNPYAPQTYSTQVIGNRFAPKKKVKDRSYGKYKHIEEVDDEEEHEKDYDNEEEIDAEEVYADEKKTSVEMDEDVSKFIGKRKYNKRLWYKCIWNTNECKYRSYRRSALVFHIKKHINCRPFQCQWPRCGATFIQKFQLFTHQMTHRGEKPYRCNFPNCMFSTIRAGALKIHKIRHSGVKRFVCSVKDCRARFSVKVSLIKHSRVHAAVDCR